jgi:hypothetical protein
MNSLTDEIKKRMDSAYVSAMKEYHLDGGSDARGEIYQAVYQELEEVLKYIEKLEEAGIMLTPAGHTRTRGRLFKLYPDPHSPNMSLVVCGREEDKMYPRKNPDDGT